MPVQNEIGGVMNGGRAMAEMLRLHGIGPMFGMGGFQLLPFYDAIGQDLALHAGRLRLPSRLEPRRGGVEQEQREDRREHARADYRGAGGAGRLRSRHRSSARARP